MISPGSAGMVLRSRLSRRFAVVTTVLALIITAAIGGASLLTVHRITTESIEQSLRETAALHGERVAAQLASVTASLFSLAGNSLIADTLMNRPRRDSAPAAFPQTIVVADQAVRITLTDAQGMPMAGNVPDGASPPPADWVARIVGDGTPLAVVVTRRERDLLVLGAPVPDPATGAAVGALLYEIPLAALGPWDSAGTFGVVHHLLHRDPATGAAGRIGDAAGAGRAIEVIRPVPVGGFLAPLGLAIAAVADRGLIDGPLTRLAGGCGLIGLAAVLAGIAASLWASRVLMKQLWQLETVATSVVTSGSFDTRFTVTGNDEIARLAAAFNNMMDRLAAAYAELTRRAEADLLHSERRYRAIFEHAPIAIGQIDLSGRLIEVNPAYARMVGYAAGELEGRSLVDLTHPDDVEATYRSLRAVIDGRDATSTIEKRFVDRDGRIVWGQATVATVPGADGSPAFSVGMVQDITLRKAAEQALKESEERFRSAFNLGMIGMAITSPEKGWVEVNGRLCEILGYGKEELTTLTWSALTHPDDLAAVEAAFDQVMRGEADGYAMENRYIRKDGRIIDASIAVRCLRDPDGSVTYFVALVDDITERKCTEETLRKLSRGVEQSMASVMITDLAGRIEYVNPRFVEVTGYSMEEALGRNPRFLKSGRTPPEEYRAMWAAITAGSVWRGEFHNRRKDGSLFWEGASISPIRNEKGAITHFIAVKEDITEIKRLQAKLRISEERFRGASEASPDGLFLFDAVRDAAGEVQDFRFFDVNAAGCAMMGMAKEQVIGRLLCDLVPDCRTSGFFEKFRTVLQTGRVLDEQFRVDVDYLRPKWVHHTVVPLADGIAITSRDITEMKAREAALKAARVAAEEANHAKSMFLARMSHELRTPLNAIIGFSEIIRDEVHGPCGSPKYRDYAGDILASGQHLLDLITDILDIAKIESGKLEIAPELLDLAHLLKSCATMVRERAKRGGLNIEIAQQECAVRLWADERAVKQIMFNLLSNAIKFTPRGGSITVHARPAVKSGSEGGPEGGIEIAVADTGSGIPADKLERVFRPFEQADNLYNRPAGGTGLGLSLVKGLIELHCGTVAIASTVGKGTTVTLRFPPPPPEVRRTMAAASVIGADRLQG